MAGKMERKGYGIELNQAGPSPGLVLGVRRLGATRTSGKRWSLVISRALTTLQGLKPRCSCPTVGSTSTTTTAPRPSLMPDSPPSLHLARTGYLSRPGCPPVRQQLPLAARATILPSPAQQVLRFRDVGSPWNAGAPYAGGGRVPGVRHPDELAAIPRSPVDFPQ
jgi:hypothetical protein